MLLAFNLLPIPPLDGFHVLEELLPYRIRSKEGYRKFEMFSPYAIWVVFILSRVTGLNILSQVISWIELPFALVINGACYLVSLPFG
jgi:Zn-dependent protease